MAEEKAAESKPENAIQFFEVAISEVQLKHLRETQAAVAGAREALQVAEREANRVLELVFDHLAIPASATVDLDPQNGKLRYAV